jgi:hypothetical protein
MSEEQRLLLVVHFLLNVTSFRERKSCFAECFSGFFCSLLGPWTLNTKLPDDASDFTPQELYSVRTVSFSESHKIRNFFIRDSKIKKSMHPNRGHAPRLPAGKVGDPPLSSHDQAMVGGQSAADVIDPWVLYGGNVAAACQATNLAVVDQQQEEGNIGEDDDKRRQRASSRLTAWQSRERKRIEFEVLQERQTELKGRNIVKQRENEQLKLLIECLKATKRPGEALPEPMPAPNTAAPVVHQGLNLASIAGATSNAYHQNLARRQHTENLLFPYPGANRRRDLPHLFATPPNRGGFDSSMLFQQNTRMPLVQGNGFLTNNDIVTPTVFAPLTRRQPMEQQQPSLSGLPFNLSSLLNPTEEKVNIPLFRAISKRPSSKRKGEKEEGSPKKAPRTEKKRPLSSTEP